MWGDPDLNEDDDWEVVTPKARKPNRRAMPQQPKLKLTDEEKEKEAASASRCSGGHLLREHLRVQGDRIMPQDPP